jgi:hypothetical protein
MTDGVNLAPRATPDFGTFNLVLLGQNKKQRARIDDPCPCKLAYGVPNRPSLEQVLSKRGAGRCSACGRVLADHTRLVGIETALTRGATVLRIGRN